jgi:hypothetical protein
MAAHLETDAGDAHVLSNLSDDPNAVALALEGSYRKAITEANASQIEELRGAKDSIAKDKDELTVDRAIRSFDRAADAIKNGIRVFISYKFIHRPLAEKFCEIVKEYGQKRLARDPDDQPYVFLAQQNLKHGREYRQQIREEIAKAHWFFSSTPRRAIRPGMADLRSRLFSAGHGSLGATHLRSSQEHRQGDAI